jgi:hypothetical protein
MSFPACKIYVHEIIPDLKRFAVCSWSRYRENAKDLPEEEKLI